MVANLETIGPNIESQPLNNNFAALNSAKVEKSGDTMTGTLRLAADFPLLFLGQSIDEPNKRNFKFDINGQEIKLQSIDDSEAWKNDILVANHDGTYIYLGSGRRGFVFGAASPEGNVTAPPGMIYVKMTGGAGATLYVKESGTGNTGWVAK